MNIEEVIGFMDKTEKEIQLNKTLGYVQKIMAAWALAYSADPDKCKQHDPEIMENSFICKVLNKRVEAFDLKIVIPDQLSVLIEFCTEGNPGQSLMILAEILEKLKKPVPEGYCITPHDFVNTFPNKFPIVSYSEIDEQLDKRWQDQKIKNASFPSMTNNQCDGDKYWLNLLGR